MSPSNTITLRRSQLGQVLTGLTAEACRILLHLAHRACPKTGRIWSTPVRIADELNLPALEVDTLLATLIAEGHLTLWARGVAALRCYDLGALFVRSATPPENLPVASDP